MKSSCPICRGAATLVENPFCTTHAQLIYPEANLQQQICDVCGHGRLTHDIPLEILYSSAVALPTDHSQGDLRFAFIRHSAPLDDIDGVIVDIGGGPGELADVARREMGRQSAFVFDFVDRVSVDNVQFVPIDLNREAHRLSPLLAAHRDQTNLFMLSHVVEHLADPFLLLAELHKFRNSLVYVEVPNFGASHGIESLKFSLNNLDHCHYFTDRSLLELVQKAGFRVLAFETQTPPHMPALRVLCTPRQAGNALGDYRAHFATVAGRLAQVISEADADQEIWVWGLSAFMAKALADLGPAKNRVRRILDTRYDRPDYLGIGVMPEPDDAPPAGGASLLIVCGSTYSTVQGVIRAKAMALAPKAEFVALTF